MELGLGLAFVSTCSFFPISSGLEFPQWPSGRAGWSTEMVKVNFSVEDLLSVRHT